MEIERQLKSNANTFYDLFKNRTSGKPSMPWNKQQEINPKTDRIAAGVILQKKSMFMLSSEFRCNLFVDRMFFIIPKTKNMMHPDVAILMQNKTFISHQNIESIVFHQPKTINNYDHDGVCLPFNKQIIACVLVLTCHLKTLKQPPTFEQCKELFFQHKLCFYVYHK